MAGDNMPRLLLREMASLEAQRSPEDAAGVLMEDGAIVIRGAVSEPGVLEAARAHVDSSLAAALSAAGEASTAPDSNLCGGMDATGEEQDSEHRWFGNVQARSHRRDLKLQLAAPVAAALQEMLSAIGGCLAEVLTPNAELCELAALVSDPGAPAQQIHPDTQIVQGNSHAGLCTAFLALQDISADMGPTEVAPRTHVAAAHDALAKDPALAFSPRQDDSWGQVQTPVLQAGDLLLMDSRAWHRGGANTSAKRRVLLYISMQVPANAPVGSTYSLLDEYQGRFFLHNQSRWTDSAAAEYPLPC